MPDESMLKYSNEMLIKDAIAFIFKTDIKAYKLENFVGDDIEYLIKKFSNVYEDYIMDSFKKLDIQTVTIEGKNYILMSELMSKVASILASKLAIEIILAELKFRIG